MPELNNGPLAGAEAKAVNASAPRVTPAQIIDTNFAFAQSCALLAAVELDLFTRIAQGLHTAAQIAQQAGFAESALRRLLGALSAMGFLQRTGEEYALTPLSERFLVRTQPSYIGDLALQTRQEWDAWIHLADIVRTGEPGRLINEEPQGGTFFAPLSEYLFPVIYPLMRQVCKRLEVGTRLRGIQVLDLGAGTAPEAIAALEADSDAHAVVLDFPEVLEKARAYTHKHGVDSRVEYWSANLESVGLPEERFDLAFASHIFRLLGEEVTRRLIRQSYNALKPGGRLVVVETYNEQSERLFPYIVALNMLVNTRHGDTFTAEQMRTWLVDAGFAVEVWPNVGPDLIQVATRP
jgi:ubiquinone/menaquinone biosynthesis C-methylase UbiE